MTGHTFVSTEQNGMYMKCKFGDTAKKEQCHFTTVKGMEMQYSALDRKRAAVVRSLQECLGFPSNVDLANAINYNIVGNCQLNQRNIRIANKIFVPSVAAVKGKSTKQWNKMQHLDVVTDLPKEILDMYQEGRLGHQYNFCEQVHLFHSNITTHWINTLLPIASNENKQVVNVMQHIIDQYKLRGFKISTVHGDNEFTGMDE